MSSALSGAPAVSQADPFSNAPAQPGSLRQMFDALVDLYASTSGQEFLFIFFAGLALLCAVVTITRRRPVVAAVWLVGSFFCVAVCYVVMVATFLAALQVLVYAGAMMVLFVFVVMVLDVDTTGATARKRIPRVRGLAYYGAAGGVLLFVTWVCLGTLSRQVMVPGPDLAGSDFGTATAVGRELFDEYLFAFEAVSLLLLAAVVGAVVVARSRRERTQNASVAGRDDDARRAAGSAGPEADELRPDLSDAEVRRPNPAMDFGAPSAVGHKGGN